MLTNEPAIDVLTNEVIRAGVTVAHRRFATPYKASAMTWPSRRFPACQPEHVHGCDNDGKGVCSLGVCHCPCNCGDGWRQYGASRAAELAAVPCAAAACFPAGSGSASAQTGEDRRWVATRRKGLNHHRLPAGATKTGCDRWAGENETGEFDNGLVITAEEAAALESKPCKTCWPDA